MIYSSSKYLSILTKKDDTYVESVGCFLDKLVEKIARKCYKFGYNHSLVNIRRSSIINHYDVKRNQHLFE